jgi:integrase
MSKRAHGEGTIQPDLVRGGYLAQVSLGYVNGKRIRKTIRAATQAEVLDKLDKARATHKRAEKLGLPADLGKQTVGEYLQFWLEQIVRHESTPKTYISYEQQVRLHIAPLIGHIKLSELRPQHVRAMLAEKKSSKLSARSVQYLRSVLRSALSTAVTDDLLEMNVAARVKGSSEKGKEVEPLTPEQARALLDAVRGHRLETLFTVGVALGMRQGEQLGLLWDFVDLDAGKVRVEWGLQRLTVKLPDGTKRTEIHLVPPKKHSRRTITLPQVVLAALRAHRAQQIEEREFCGSRWKTPMVHREGKQVTADFVFTTPIGTPLEPCNLNKQFQAILKGCGIPHHRYHDLRHTAATLLKLQKVSDQAIMEILGWSQISMLARYTHVLDEMRADAAQKMNDVLTARPEQPSGPDAGNPVEKNLLASRLASRERLYRVK